MTARRTSGVIGRRARPERDYPPPTVDPTTPPGLPTNAPRAAPVLGVVLLVTGAVTVLSYVLPEPHQATGVGLAFLVATFLLVLRRDTLTVRRHGLSLGGLLETTPLSAPRLVRDATRAVAWAALFALLVFPPFWFGWLFWWRPESAFRPAGLSPLLEDALGQLLVIALPEEAFYRGYVQSALDAVWPPRLRVLGAKVGPALLVTSALFALGHLATDLDLNRLGVFFPSLLFGWLRARTGGIGAALVFHALCNLFASYLARSYGYA